MPPEGCISVQAVVTAPIENEATYGVTPGARQRIEHIFSEPVIIGIIYGVMAGTVGIILSISYCARLLRKKNAFNVQPTESVDAGDPLSSVETENPAVRWISHSRRDHEMSCPGTEGQTQLLGTAQ
ncbi:Glycophorin-A [Manis pentadactyla]|nr:Glycophorin-A [Manis pentadactyla]